MPRPVTSRDMSLSDNRFGNGGLNLSQIRGKKNNVLFDVNYNVI